MKLEPTKRIKMAISEDVECPRSYPYLTISIVLPDGHRPTSWFRTMNVGVGGKFMRCPVAPGEPVRRATLNELRRLDRLRLAAMIEMFPNGEVHVQRGWV